MKKNALKIVIVFVALLVTELMFSQTPPSRTVPPPGLPIDGGILSLIAVAFGYGVNKLRNRDK